MIRRALRTWAGGLPATFWTLWVGTLINRIGSFVTPFLALYLTTERGLSVAAAGGLVAATGAGSVLSQPLGGALADRVGPAVLGREPRVQRGGRRRRPAGCPRLRPAVRDRCAHLHGVCGGRLAPHPGDPAARRPSRGGARGPGLVAELAPPALRGRYAGAYGLTWGLGFTITPLVGAAALGDGGATTPWMAGAVLSAGVAMGLLALGPRLQARRAVAARAAAVAA